LQDRLPKEQALEGIDTIDQASAFLQRSFWKCFNRRFMVEPRVEDQHAFVPPLHTDLGNILRLQKADNLCAINMSSCLIGTECE
jgi:hypothetical protein